MSPVRLRSDLDRAVIDGFALPLGIQPGELEPPEQGFTVAYTTGRDDEPDTYSFYVAVSHERIAPIVERAFSLLPDQVAAIVEISSRDAYRQIDVFLSRDEIRFEDFEHAWKQWHDVLMEDGSIAAGANSEEPFVEVFLDQWKGLSIIVPLTMREQVEKMLRGFELEEVPQTWPIGEDNPGLDEVQIRPVIDACNGQPADIDDVLMALRREWQLDLNVDPDTNIDEAGRRLGLTLWHAVLGVEEHPEDGPPAVSDLSVWATAGSLHELEGLIDEVLRSNDRWVAAEIYSTDRVAYDERPDELGDLRPKREQPEVHMVSVEPRESGP